MRGVRTRCLKYQQFFTRQLSQERPLQILQERGDQCPQIRESAARLTEKSLGDFRDPRFRIH